MERKNKKLIFSADQNLVFINFLLQVDEEEEEEIVGFQFQFLLFSP